MVFNIQNMKNKNGHLQSSQSLVQTGYHLRDGEQHGGVPFQANAA